MKGSNLFYGILLAFFAYLLNIETFDVNVNIPPFLSIVSITNPLHVFAPFTILVVVLALVCIGSAFEGKSEKKAMPNT